MAYATQADIEAVYGADLLLVVADRDNDGVVDAAAVSQALDAATSLIDVHLAVRYQTPLASVPELVRGLAIDIAVYKLSGEGNGLSEEKRKRYEDAMALLKRIAEGKADLDLPSSIAAPKSCGIIIQSGPERVFSRNRLRGF